METTTQPDVSAAATSSRPQCVLLVEDDAMLRRCIARMLEHHGRRVWCAGDGIEALEIFRERAGEIDVVILDISMPRSDGPTTLAKLRTIDPCVPVIFSSGQLDDRLDTSVAAGVQGVLPKPYTSKQMLEVLRSFQ